MRKSLQSLQPLKAVWYQSWTKAWGWCQAVSGAGLLTISKINDYTSDQTFKSYLDMIDIPKSVTITLAILGMVTWLAHGRENDA